jgi:hypothetical protein
MLTHEKLEYFVQVSNMDVASPADSGGVSAGAACATPAGFEHVSSQPATPMQTADAQESGLSTRMFVSDEQRSVKQRFEEKQREEARRNALAEKQAKRKVCMDKGLMNSLLIFMMENDDLLAHFRPV